MSYLKGKNLSKTSRASQSQPKRLSAKSEGAAKGTNMQSRKGRTHTSRQTVSNPGWFVIQVTVGSSNTSNLPTTEAISLQHTHSKFVGMIEQWSHAHLKTIKKQPKKWILFTLQSKKTD